MKIIKFIIALFLIPVAFGFSKMFFAKLPALQYISGNFHYFVWGMVSYMLSHILFFKPNYLFTWGHEAIHAVATWICGGHITSFHVSKDGGQVSTSKTNFFIELSPYFIPIYTLFFILITPLLKTPLYRYGFMPAYIFLLGFTLAMHLIMTAESLKIRQPDVVKSGYVFSLMVIYVGNLLIVFLVFSLLFRGVTFKNYFLESLGIAKNIYVAFWHRLF